MAQYKPNSDSFNQLLLKLDEHGARANFIDELHRRHKTDSFQWLDHVRTEIHKPPAELLLGSFYWNMSTDGNDFWADIYRKMGGSFGYV